MSLSPDERVVHSVAVVALAWIAVVAMSLVFPVTKTYIYNMSNTKGSFLIAHASSSRRSIFL